MLAVRRIDLAGLALALAAGIAPGDEVPTFADKAIATQRGG